MENAKKDIMKPETNHINMSPSNSKHNSTFPIGKVRKNSSVGKVVKPKITLKLTVPKKESLDGSRPASSRSQLSDEVSNTYDFSDKESDNHVKSEYVYVFKLLSHHIVKRKQGTKMYKCDVCGATYRHVFSLKRHFLRNHVNYKYLSEADISNCKINFSPDDEQSASAAKHGNMVAKQEQSEILESVESDPDDLRGNETVLDLFRCHRCLDLKFDSLNALKQHFETHQGSAKAQFSCDHCDAVFAQRLAFIRHKASHVNKKQFVCSTCDLSFDSRSSYLKHVSTHSNGKACKHCGKIFSTSANRKRHERLHEGLKPYPCRHCSLGFTQSNDLKSHIKELHRDLYYECSQCPRLLLSQESLKKHLSEKHSVLDTEILLAQSPPKATKPPVASQSALKTIQPSSLNRILSKPKIVSKPVTSTPTPLSKAYICNTCKAPFASYMQLSKHKTNEHPPTLLQGKRKPPKKAINYSGYSVFKRRVMSSTRSRDLTEQEFYLSVSEQIRENLTNFVDGKPSQLSLKQSEITSFSETNAENSFAGMSESWSSFNFPKDFDMKQSFQHSKAIIPSASSDSNSSDCQSNTDCGLKLSEVPLLGKLTDVTTHDSDSFAEVLDDSQSVMEDEPDEQCKEMSLEERKALIGLDVKITCVCCVCSETFDSYGLYYNHHVNNHPNVEVSYIKLEGTKDSPPFVPPGLCTQYVSPYGLLNHCHVPPSLSGETDLVCTKCKSKFPSVSDLHVHIIECGGNESIVPTFIYKKQHRRIKGTMKNRMDTTVRHAYFVKRRPDEICNCPNEKSSSTTSTVSTEPFLSVSSKENVNEILPKLSPEIDQNTAEKTKEPDYVCPVCDKLCKTKNILKAHVIRCRKGVPSEATGNVHNSQNNCESTSEEVRSATNGVAKITSSVDGENERHGASSPSLECLVDSIKQKLTSDDMSSTHSSSSWMDEEPPPDISAECEPSDSYQSNDSGGKNCVSLDHNENSLCLNPKDEKNDIAAEMDLPVLAKESNSDSEKIIPCSSAPTLPLSAGETAGNERSKKQHEENDTDYHLKKMDGDGSNSDIQTTNENLTCKSTPRKSEENQKEGDNKECPSDKHLCPYCKVKFSHVMNFRKHMDRCWKMQSKEGEASPQTSNVFPHPNKDEVEASMLNLLRNQSRQSELMKEAENSTYANKKFQSYTCDLCHKIFLCYFKMLQHRVSHKLNPEDLIKTIAEQSEAGENKQNVKADSEVATKPADVPFGDETSSAAPLSKEASTSKCEAAEPTEQDPDNQELVETMTSSEADHVSQPLELSSTSHNDQSQSAFNSERSLPSHPTAVSVSPCVKRKKNLPPPPGEVRVKRKKPVANLNNKSQRSSVGDGTQVPAENSSPNNASNESDVSRKEIHVKNVKPEPIVKTVSQEKATKRKSVVPSVVKSESSSDILSDVQGTFKTTKRKPQDECNLNKIQTSSGVSDTRNDNLKTVNRDSLIPKAGTSSNSVSSDATPRDDVTCPVCTRVFTAPFYRNRHLKHMHKVKEEKLKLTEQKKDKLKQTEEHKKDKLKQTEEHKKDKLKQTEEHKKDKLKQTEEQKKDKLKQTEEQKKDKLKQTEEQKKDKLKQTEEQKKDKLKQTEEQKKDKLKQTEEQKKDKLKQTEEQKKDKLKQTDEQKKDEKLKPAEEQKKEDKRRQTDEPKKVKIIAKVPKKKILPKNNRRVFQRQCKKDAITKRINSKQNGMKKTSPLRKSPPKKTLLVKKRTTRS